MNTTAQFSILLCFSFLLFQCSPKNLSPNKELHIYNSHNEQAVEKFRSLNLDNEYPGLVSNEEAKTEKMKDVNTAFSEFAYSISDYLEEKEFEWEIPDSTVNLFIRGYFNPDGSLEHLFYKVKSENVSQEKKEEFGEAIKPFLKEIKFSIQQEDKFAQCGSLQYWIK